MKKIVILLIFLWCFPLVAKDNIILPLLDFNGNNNGKNELILISHENPLYNMLVFNIIEGSVCASNLEDINDAIISTNWNAKIISGSCDNKDFVIFIYDPIDNSNKYKIQKNPASNFAVLSVVQETGENTILANTYFQIQNSKTNVILIKRKDFEVQELSFYNLLGVKLSSFYYDSYEYVFDTMNLPLGMYFIYLKTTEKTLVFKFIFN